MPRVPTAPMLGWTQISLPVAPSRATTELFCARTYITPSTTMGSKTKVPGPVGYIQATASCLTFDLLICLSDEYCDESAPPRYWLQVEKDRSAAVARNPVNRHSASAQICFDGYMRGTPSTAPVYNTEGRALASRRLRPHRGGCVVNAAGALVGFGSRGIRVVG